MLSVAGVFSCLPHAIPEVIAATAIAAPVNEARTVRFMMFDSIARRAVRNSAHHRDEPAGQPSVQWHPFEMFRHLLRPAERLLDRAAQGLHRRGLAVHDEC